MKYISVTARDMKDFAAKLNNFIEKGGVIESVSFQMDKIVYGLIRGLRPEDEKDMNGDGEISSYLVNVDLRRANGATSTNTIRDIKEGSLYTTTLINLSDDYADRIKITIGDLLGDDLSEQYFNKETRTITIPKVTGNIDIICT